MNVRTTTLEPLAGRRTLRRCRPATWLRALRPLVLLSVATCFHADALGQRDLDDIPDPDPEVERSSFVVADGFEVNLYASDPQIAKPIQMNFDGAGRLWIASSEAYPQIVPGQPPRDKILVIEDRDRDGRADHTTVFADDLLIPTGVVPGDGGAYVANSTELIHLSDTTGDGRADRRRVILSGFGTEDTHHLLHTLRWGPDGALYMNQSIYIHSHIETPRGVRRLGGGGIWRFRPDTFELDVFCRGFVNPWGHHFDEWGQSFVTDGAYREGINYAFPGAVFFSSPGAVRTLTGLNPGSPKHCGLEVASGRHLPAEWQGNLLTNDFRAHRVCRFLISEDGSGYSSRQEVELIKSDHVAFRPIDVKMGPDGAIYIADWYNPIIQHGEVDFRDPRRDHVHGRIWRVAARGRELVQRRDLERATVEQLLESLTAPEEWTRTFAKLELRSRDRRQVLAAAGRWHRALEPSDPRREHHRLELLWLHQGLGECNASLLAELLASSDHRVRAAAMRVAAAWSDRLPDAMAVFRRGVGDEHPRVRLEAVRALSQARDPQALAAALRALDQPTDRFLDFALWQTARDLEPVWLPRILSGSLELDRVDHLSFALQAVDSPQVVAPLLALVRSGSIPPDQVPPAAQVIASRGSPGQFRSLVDHLLGVDTSESPAGRAALLAAVVEAGELHRQRPAGDLSGVGRLLESSDAATRAAAAMAVGAWRIGAHRDRLASLARDADEPEAVRHAAIAGTARLGGDFAEQALAAIARQAPLARDRVEAARGLLTINVVAAAAETASLLRSAHDAGALDSLLGDLVQRRDGPAALAAALADVQLPADAAKNALRVARRSSESSEILIEAIRKAAALDQHRWVMTPEFVRELVAEVADYGDAAAGEIVYRRDDLQCLKCHAIAGAGGRVGPDLISIGASAPVDYLIESLIAPSRKVKENFHSIVVADDAGRVVSGIPIRETAAELVLLDADDREVVIPIEAIEARREGPSIMPDGLVDSLTRAELAHLVRFLSELGKAGAYSVGNAQVVRRWQTLLWTPEAHHRLNRTSFDLVAAGDPAFQWRSDYSHVSGHLPADSLPKFKPHQETNETTFLRFQLDVTTPGPVELDVGNPAGLSLWNGSSPTPLRKPLVIELPAGRQTVTVAVDRELRAEPVRIELLPVAGSPAQAQLVGGK